MNNIDLNNELNNNDLIIQISEICKEVIINPNKIKQLGKLIHIINNDSTIMLSLLKVFLHTAPLYKIKIINDNVKHKQEYLKLEKQDKEYLEVFGKFINKIIKGNDYVHYKCTTQILEHLSHFNYIEKIIIHVLEGTRNNNKVIENLCLNAISYALTEDYEGFLISKIIQQMNVFGFGIKSLELLLNIPFIEMFIEEDKYKTKLKFIKEERLKRYKNIKDKETLKLNNKRKLNIETSRSAKKEDKKSKKKIIKSINEDGKITFEQKERNFQQIINALHRIYLFILRDKMSPFYLNTFKGLLKYKTHLKKELFDGINILLKNLINEKMGYTEKMLLFKLILVLNETKCFDLEQVIKGFLICFNKSIKKIKRDKDNKYGIYSIICSIIDTFFIKNKQNIFRINKVLKNLMLSATLSFLPEFANRVYKLIDIYDIDLNEIDFCGEEESFSPYYEFDAFERMCYIK